MLWGRLQRPLGARAVRPRQRWEGDSSRPDPAEGIVVASRGSYTERYYSRHIVARPRTAGAGCFAGASGSPEGGGSAVQGDGLFEVTNQQRMKQMHGAGSAKWCARHVGWLALQLFLCVMATQAGAAETAQVNDFWKSVYEENHVLEVRLEVSRDAWDAMQPRRDERRGENRPRVSFGNQFSYAPVNLWVDGVLFEQAGLRFKGNSSFRFSERGLKRPFKIDTNRFVKGQKLHGKTKLNLSNAFLDTAFMKEKLGYELYRAAGMPTPGVGWAHVTLTVEGRVAAEPLGLYVLVEQVNRTYLEEKLGQASSKSLLMKPDAMDDWEYLGENLERYERYNLKVGEKNTQLLQRFVELLRLIEQASPEEFEKTIADRVDLSMLAGYLAATSLLVNIDSYIGMPHNYYLLMDAADDKLRMLPWDLNETFGTFTMEYDPSVLARWDIHRPWVAPRRLVERLFEMDAFRKMYHDILLRLMVKEFTEEKLFARIATFEEALLPYLTPEYAGDLRGFRMGIDGDEEGVNRAVGRRILGIKPFVKERLDSVWGQFTGEADGLNLRR